MNTVTAYTHYYDADHTSFCGAADSDGRMVLINRAFFRHHAILLHEDHTRQHRIVDFFQKTPFEKAGTLILEAVQLNQECSLTIELTDHMFPLNGEYLVKIHRVLLDDAPVFLLYIQQHVSPERRHVISRALFHDLMNSVSNLSGAANLLTMAESREEQSAVHAMLRRSAATIVEQADYYRILNEAETGTFKPHITECSFDRILIDCVDETKAWELTRASAIEIPDLALPKIEGSGAPHLVKQVLINMLRNAVEASAEGQRIEYGISVQESTVEFYVWNAAVISPEQQKKIFTLGSSTKNPQRGLGTYSMKLIGEELLGGAVSFQSDPAKGTIFRFRLPQHSMLEEDRVPTEVTEKA